MVAPITASSGMPMPGMARYVSVSTCDIAWDKRAGIDDTLPTTVHHPATLVAEGINLALIDDQDCRDAAAIDTWANDTIHVRSLECMLSLSTMFG